MCLGVCLHHSRDRSAVFPLQAVLQGQGTWSMYILASCGLAKNSAMAWETVGPLAEGTWKRGSTKVGVSVKPCWTQEGDHAPTSFRPILICSMALMTRPRQSSMAARSVQLQLAMLQGCLALDLQRAATISSMEYWSQADSTMKMGALKYLARLAALQQWQYSSYSQMHSGMGKPTPPQITSWKRLSDRALMGCSPAMGEKYSVTKSPLSGMAQTFADFVCSTRQLEQRQVAIPPADTPVMTMVSPLQKSKFSSRQRNCSRVLLYPLKQSFLSLQETGSGLLPVCSLPSQQITKILVQSWKTGFIAGFVDIIPAQSPSAKGCAFLVEPSPPKERWQQLSRVDSSVRPPQQPPLLKKMRNLFWLPPDPRWQQSPGGDPSRQAPPLSWEWRTSLQRFYWACS